MIDIVISNGIPYFWNPQDWKLLRTEYRIVGTFDGAISRSSLNSRNLPVRLSPVQTQYLLKHGLARTVEVPKLYNRKGLATKEEFLEKRNTHRTEQVSLYKERKRLELEAMVDKIIEGKRSKGRTLIPDKNAVIQDELEKINSTPNEMVKVDFHDAWIKEDDYVPYEYPEPVTKIDCLRLLVFEDLTANHKYYLTAGNTFGGDFLAYPGDPVNYHAEFIIICKPSERIIPKSSLITHERLANTVKKILIIASIDKNTSQLKYERIVGPHFNISKSSGPENNQTDS